MRTLVRMDGRNTAEVYKASAPSPEVMAKFWELLRDRSGITVNGEDINYAHQLRHVVMDDDSIPPGKDWIDKLEEQHIRRSDNARLEACGYDNRKHRRRWYNQQGWKDATKSDTQFCAGSYKLARHRRRMLWMDEADVNNEAVLVENNWGKGPEFSWSKSRHSPKLTITTFREHWAAKSAEIAKNNKLDEVNEYLSLILDEAYPCRVYARMSTNELLGRPKDYKAPEPKYSWQKPYVRDLSHDKHSQPCCDKALAAHWGSGSKRLSRARRRKNGYEWTAKLYSFAHRYTSDAHGKPPMCAVNSWLSTYTGQQMYAMRMAMEFAEAPKFPFSSPITEMRWYKDIPLHYLHAFDMNHYLLFGSQHYTFRLNPEYQVKEIRRA